MTATSWRSRSPASACFPTLFATAADDRVQPAPARPSRVSPRRDPQHQAPADRGRDGRHRPRRGRQRHAAAGRRRRGHDRGAPSAGLQQVRVSAGAAGVPSGLIAMGGAALRPSLRPGHRDAAAHRLEGGPLTPAVRGRQSRRRHDRPRARLPGVPGRLHPRGSRSVYRRASPGERLPARSRAGARGRAPAREAGVRQLSQQSDRGRRDAGVSRAHGGHLPAVRDPAGLRQRLLRSHLRRLPRPEHLRVRRARATWRSSSSRCPRASR